MAIGNKQIPNLPPVIALAGPEQFETVQAGTSARVALSQIGDYAIQRAIGYANRAFVIISDTPPPPAFSGLLWWSSALGQMFIWYDDGDSSQWVPATPSNVGSIDGSFNVNAFGADPTGVSDSTGAFQAALNQAGANAAALYGPSGAVARKAWVYVPPGTYLISHVNIPSFVGIKGGVSCFKGTRSTVIKHTDPTQSCFKMADRSSVANLFFDVNNTNMVTPVAGPPTLVAHDTSEADPKGDFRSVYDCHFHLSYIAMGSPVLPAVAFNNAWIINNCSGFFHHRMVFLKNTLDISYVSNLHSNSPEGQAWNATWYAYNNRVMAEVENADGLMGENWICWGARGLFKMVGTGNLLVTLTNICGEAITHGFEIAAGAFCGQHVDVRGGYLQTNNRDGASGNVVVPGGNPGVYLVSNEGQVDLRFANFIFAQSADTDYIRVIDSGGAASGTTTITDCTVLAAGSGTTTAFHKMGPLSRLIINDCVIRSFVTMLKFDAGCDTLVYFGPGNRVRTALGAFYGSTPTGFTDITEPVIYEAGAGNTQQAIITRRTPMSDHQMYVANSLLVHQQAVNATGNGGAFEASASNTSSATSLGSRARFKAYNTSGTPGNESARAWIQGYSAGIYGPPLVVFEKGSPGYQAGNGSGGNNAASPQTPDKSAGVTINTTTGHITMNAASLAANTTVSFTLTNSVIGLLDILHIKHHSGGTFGAYRIEALEAAGSASVRVTNITAGALAEAIVLKFYIFKTTTN